VKALPGEADGPEFASLPRIVFLVNGRCHGRLRRSIDPLDRSVCDDH